jgi:hypothetical protein
MPVLDRTSLSSGDTLDDLLRAYFQAQMPSPWPTLSAPQPEHPTVPFRPPVRRLSPLARGRLALAASVALLIGAGLYTAGLMGARPAPDLPANTSTTAGSRDPHGPLQYKENLIQKADGTYIQIEIYELPPGR